MPETVSLNLLGGGANPTEHFPLHDHMPFRQPWRDGYFPTGRASAIVDLFMGPGYPTRSIAQEIWDSLEFYAHRYDKTAESLFAYLQAITPRGVTILKALRRNFRNHPERWEGI